jgi:hypothetical protein
MIIAESDKHYRMITQNDHRDLAGSSPPTISKDSQISLVLCARFPG